MDKGLAAFRKEYAQRVWLCRVVRAVSIVIWIAEGVLLWQGNDLSSVLGMVFCMLNKGAVPVHTDNFRLGIPTVQCLRQRTGTAADFQYAQFFPFIQTKNGKIAHAEHVVKTQLTAEIECIDALNVIGPIGVHGFTLFSLILNVDRNGRCFFTVFDERKGLAV